MIAETARIRMVGSTRYRYSAVQIPTVIQKHLNWEPGTHVLVVMNDKRELVVRRVEDVEIG